MNLREAAQQALNALEWYADYSVADVYALDAAAALRAALAAPEQEPVGWVYIDRATGDRTFSRHMAGFVDHSTTVEAPVYAEAGCDRCRSPLWAGTKCDICGRKA